MTVEKHAEHAKLTWEQYAREHAESVGRLTSPLEKILSLAALNSLIRQEIPDSEMDAMLKFLNQVAIPATDESDVDAATSFTMHLIRLAIRFESETRMSIEEYPKLSERRKIFQRRAVETFSILNACIRIKIRENALLLWFTTVARFLGDSNMIWTTNEINEKANESIYLLMDLYKKKTTVDIVSLLFRKVLAFYVRPYFDHPDIDPDTKRKRRAHPALDLKPGEFYESQPWKIDQVGTIELLEWCAYQIMEFDSTWNELLPPIMTLIDDAEPPYKTRGLLLMRHCFIDKVSPADIRSTGLGDVFVNAVSKCWTYLDHADLFETSLIVSTELASVVHVRESEEYYKLLERIMSDGILRNMTFAPSGKVQILKIMLRQASILVPKLSIFIFKYLKPLLGSCCELLSYYTPSLQFEAAQVVHILLKYCWPRAVAYKGMILASLAESWRLLSLHRHRYPNETADAEKLESCLQECASLLVSLCQASIQADVDVLLEMDSELYSRLFGVPREE